MFDTLKALILKHETATTPGRIDKEAANYKRQATPEQLMRGEQCGGCVFFNYDVLDRGPHTCEIVFGAIEFEGVCDLYRPSIAREDPDSPMEHDTAEDGGFMAIMRGLRKLRRGV